MGELYPRQGARDERARAIRPEPASEPIRKARAEELCGSQQRGVSARATKHAGEQPACYIGRGG